jgi:hypothetical protein
MGTTFLEQIRMKTGHRVMPAQKADKLGFVALTNDDLVDGRLKVMKGSVLATQMAALQWDESGKRENKSQRNDACDASIYARGAITRYISHSEPVADPVRSPEQELLEKVLGKPNRGDAPYMPGNMYTPDPRS